MAANLHATPAKNHILIVEDNMLTTTQLKAFFEGEGFVVTICQNASETKAFLEMAVPDLIILDIILPEMDGYELCRQIRNEARLRLIPIIFLSAKTEIDDKILGLQAGGDDYLTKPFAPTELLARVEVILHRMHVFHEMSMRDELTGAYNRRYFNERLGEELHRARRNSRNITVAMIDIDHFKKVNDNYGHQVGDFVLQKLVGFLKNNLRRSDLVARFGGEEFVVLLTEIEPTTAELLFDRIRLALESETFVYTNEPLYKELALKITVSIGIATFPGDAKEVDNLVMLADSALYQAKNSGRNRVARISKG